MGSTRRGGHGHVSAQQYLSIRSTDIILPSRLNSPNPGSSPSLSYVSPDTTFPRRYNKQPWKLLCRNPRLESRCPTLLPHNPGQFTVRPYDYASLHPRQTRLCISPATPPGFPMHNIFQMDTTATCHVEPRYLKQPIPRGTYCNTLYSIHNRYIYSLYQHIQITPRDNVYIQVARRDTSRTEGSMENVVQKH